MFTLTTPLTFLQVIKDMYAKTELCVNVHSNHTTDFFTSDIGSRQENPNLFKIIYK